DLSRKAIEQSIAEQIDSEKLRRHAPVTRHVPITILTHNQDNVLIMMGGVHSPNTPIFKITKEGIERKIADDTEIPAIHDRNPITHYRNGRYASYYIKDAQEHLLYTSRKPHVIFKDNEGNLHTIKEEKLTVPILGLLSFILGDMCTFLIRYHDVQLTRVDTNAPTLTDASHIILQSNPFGWKNAIRTV